VALAAYVPLGALQPSGASVAAEATADIAALALHPDQEEALVDAVADKILKELKPVAPRTVASMDEPSVHHPEHIEINVALGWAARTPAHTHTKHGLRTLANSGTPPTCVSRSVYDTLVDTSGSTSQAIESGGKAISVIFLAVWIIVGLFMLILGEKFLHSAVLMVTSYISFIMFLYLWDWIFTPEGTVWDATFVKCWLPLLLAFLCSLVITMIVQSLMKSIEWLTFFVFGAGVGFIGMMALRSAIIAGDPSLTDNSNFNWYWVGLVSVSIITGCIAVWMRKVVIMVCTVVLGAYMLATGILGIIALYDTNGFNGGVFFAIWIPAMIVGALVQIFVVKVGKDD